jgi:hypothetical protein
MSSISYRYRLKSLKSLKDNSIVDAKLIKLNINSKTVGVVVVARQAHKQVGR